MPADDDMPELPRGLRPRQNERLRLLRAVSNHKPVAVDADCRAGAAHHDHAILDNSVIGVIRVPVRALVAVRLG